MPQPLPLPEHFNPQTFLIARHTENGVFHEVRRGAALAAQLVANGTPEDLALAEKVLGVVLGCQEHHPEDPHAGNFLWMLEDEVVEDLNAVQFNLEHLIPMMLRYRQRLAPALQERVLEAIRLGLEEVCRLDVLVAYTNITVLDILNTSLGGELLQDPSLARRGYRKLVDWMALTDANGIPFEYNSPTYAAVTLRALKTLADLVQDEATRIRARTVSARLGLSVALHIHTGTGRWAGPHSRAYHPSVVCETAPEIELLRGWIADGTVPAWVAGVLHERPDTFQVDETASVDRQLGISTYHTPAYALGVSTQAFGGQSNVVLAHYVRPGADRPGVMYTRYLTNEKWLGDFYHATDRTTSRNLIEEGQFYGVQQGPRAIGLYTFEPSAPIHSAKAALIWTGAGQIDEVWVGDSRVDAWPAEVPPGAVVVIGSGEAWFAVWPLTRTRLGRDAPARLVERAGDLVLELYNYLGPQKSFWELRWPGAFYKGRPQCGFYLEVAPRDAYPDGRALGRVVAGGSLVDETAPPFTYAGVGERLWRVEYVRDGQALGLEVDLMAWTLKRRWTQVGPLGWPMLEAPMARETRSGHIELGGATLDCGAEAAWLWANPDSQCWVGGYHGQQPAPLSLSVPGGAVRIRSMGTGIVVWHKGEVTVIALALSEAPQVQGGVLRRLVGV